MQTSIRNFAIIAHVDHGKSTLADRFLELTGTVDRRHLVSQTLDTHPVSRERGITIRLAPVTMPYILNFKSYILNLIDTPGHVDFSYEVERSLAACEGAILLIDATAGIQAQTLSHFRKARALGLTIIPAINKIDLPNARITEAEEQINNLLANQSQGWQREENSKGESMRDHARSNIKDDASLEYNTSWRESTRDSRDESIREVRADRTPSIIHKISAKTGEGIPQLLNAVVEKIPPPGGQVDDPVRALVFSSQFDPARGVTAYIRIVDGSIQSKSKIRFLAANTEATAFEIGHFSPAMTPTSVLETGEVGYVTTNLKDPSLIRVGDTITLATSHQSLVTSLPGYRQPKPMVFVSFFPIDQNDFASLEDSLKKLKLNDAAISFSPTSSRALGRGFRCGLLGHLHAEITQERLSIDFGLPIIATPPSVEYKTLDDRGSRLDLEARKSKLDKEKQTSNLQLQGLTSSFQHRPSTVYLEPWVRATIITPQDYIGAVLSLCEDRRGKMINIEYHGRNATLTYELPLAEIATSFFDQLKSKTSGFGSLDYELVDYRPFEAVQLDILINHEEIDAFSQIMEKSRAEKYGRFLVERLKEVILRQQIPIPIQASIDGQIIARADIPAFRKDVTAKLYGGDVTRRMKLLEKQKKGKEKMLALSRAEGRQIGKVTIPNDTFLKIFKV